MRSVVKLFAAGGLAAAMSVGAADASIVQLSMSSPIDGTGMNSIYPYMAPGDIATLTVRYDTDTAATSSFGASTLYQNAITYFEYSIERSGVELYSGSISGAFGQVSVTDHSASGSHDALAFRIFDDVVDYPSGTRNGTNPAPDLPAYVTGDAFYGDLFFHDFRMQFSTVDEMVLTSEALPTLADLTVPGGGSPFAVQYGNTPWSGAWEFENGHQYGPSGFGFGTFGPGARRQGESYEFTASASEYTPGGGSDVSEVPLPAAAPLFAFGLAGLAGLRRRARKRV